MGFHGGGMVPAPNVGPALLLVSFRTDESILLLYYNDRIYHDFALTFTYSTTMAYLLIILLMFYIIWQTKGVKGKKENEEMGRVGRKLELC